MRGHSAFFRGLKLFFMRPRESETFEFVGATERALETRLQSGAILEPYFRFCLMSTDVAPAKRGMANLAKSTSGGEGGHDEAAVQRGARPRFLKAAKEGTPVAELCRKPGSVTPIASQRLPRVRPSGSVLSGQRRAQRVGVVPARARRAQGVIAIRIDWSSP